MSIYVGTTEITGLPGTYQQVQYIQTTGTQFIDTGLYSSSSIQTETKIELTTTSQNLPVFGGCYSGDAPYMNTYYHLTPYNSYWYYGINGPGTEGHAGTYNPTVGTQYTIIYNGTNNGLYINGTNIATITGTTGYPGSTLSISARGGTGSQNPKRYGQYKFFYFRMYDKSTGKYVRDMIPCYRKSDNVIGMYDLVNNQFYTNAGTGTFTKGSNVTAKGIYVGTTPVKSVYVGTTKVRPALITTPGIYHNASEGLISISSDGTNWITIADKNLGATTVYNYGDTLSAANVGNVYQRGNNYGFPYTGSMTVSTGTVNASSYGPGNYYSSSTFRYYQSGYGYWDSSNNDNLWGDTTNTKEARRGPCNSGYHIASQSERGSLITVMTALGLTSQTNWCTYLKIPKNGYRRGNDGGTVQQLNTNAYWWSSTPTSTGKHGYDLAIESSIYNTDNSGRSSCLIIRPMKNDSVQPNNNRTKLY